VRLSPLVDRIAGEETGAWRVPPGTRAPPRSRPRRDLSDGRRSRPGRTPTTRRSSAIRRARCGRARFERRTGRPCSADNIVLTYSTTTPSPIFRVFAADPHTGVVHFHDHVDALGDGE